MLGTPARWKAGSGVGPGDLSGVERTERTRAGTGRCPAHWGLSRSRAADGGHTVTSVATPGEE